MLRALIAGHVCIDRSPRARLRSRSAATGRLTTLAVRSPRQAPTSGPRAGTGAGGFIGHADCAIIRRLLRQRFVFGPLVNVR